MCNMNGSQTHTLSKKGQTERSMCYMRFHLYDSTALAKRDGQELERWSPGASDGVGDWLQRRNGTSGVMEMFCIITVV